MADKKKSSRAGNSTRIKKKGLVPPRKRRLPVKSRDKITPMPVAEAQRLVHELQVHQVELEMQNQELRRTQLELATARSRHADLYDFAPSALLTLNAGGEILEANLNAGKLLGLERRRLLQQKFTRFVAAEAQDTFHRLCRQAFGSNTRQSMELALVDAQAKPLFVQVEAVRDMASLPRQCRFSFNDLTKRKQAEEELRQSEERYRLVVEDQTEAISRFDADGTFTYVNTVFCRLVGKTRQELLGNKWQPRAVEGDVPMIQERLRTLSPANPIVVIENRIYDRTGEIRWFQFVNRALYNAAGGLVETQSVGRDITERKRAEERIAQLNRAQAILAGIDHVIVHTIDRQKLLDEACRVALEKGGFKLAWVGMIAPDGSVQPVAQSGVTEYLKGIRVVTQDVPAGRGAIGTAIRENRTVVIEDIARNPCMAPWHERTRQFGLEYVAVFPLRIDRKVVGTFQVYAPRSDFFDANELALLTQVSDDISFALTALADLDARKKAEEALRLNEHHLSIFFNHAPIGLAWLAADGTILRVNQAHLNVLGYSLEDYLGHGFNEFCEKPSQGRELLNRLAANETVRNFPMTRRRKDGQIRQVLVDADSFWKGDQLQYSSLFLRDITDRLELERETLQATEREHRRIAQDLHDGLGQLLAGTAYLTSTLRQKLAAQSLPESQELGRILEVIYEAIAQTRNLARGLHPVEPEPNGLMVALQALALRTKKLFRVGGRFTCRRPVLIKDNVVATHLFRIAQEAITNAIKHGKPGRIQIGLTETRGRLNLTVKDNGTGLPARQHKKPGMGLRIMRYRAGMIGGSLTLQKAAGGGTAVICTVPLSGRDAENPAPKKD